MIEKLITIEEKPYRKVFIPQTAEELLQLFLHQSSFEGYTLKVPAAFDGDSRYRTIREIQKFQADHPLTTKWQLPWFEK